MLFLGRSRRPPLFVVRLWIPLCCLAFLLSSVIVVAAEDPLEHVSPSNEPTPSSHHVPIPERFLGSFGDYPNLLQLNDEDRELFHPVLVVPNGTTAKRLDFQNAKGLASPEGIQRAKRQRWRTWLTRPLRSVFRRIWKRSRTREHWTIGCYDENRVEMYSSEHFQDTENQIDGYGGQRTVHLGIDLGGPVGTKVHAFSNGVVHSVGYNPDYGDYGYVIVVQHELPSGVEVWALYGHLDKSTLRGKQPGAPIRKGQVLGRLGDCHENGGWVAPHVHFQLAMRAPETHDMPGASSVQDRTKALLDYPDPRYVLGPLY